MANSLPATVSSFMTGIVPAGLKCFVVALSGGADSVALLSLCTRWSRAQGDRPRCEALHVHHGLRGEEADRDARHCAQVCSQLQVPLHVVSEPIEMAASSPGVSIETAGRDARRRRFVEICSARSTSLLLTGHHGDDQAETVLGNLLRGCGLRGLRAMQGVSQIDSSQLTIARPLLTCFRSEIEQYLQEVGLTGIEDLSNRSRDHRRNRIRIDLLPMLKRESPEVVSHLLALSDEAKSRWNIVRGRIDSALQLAHLSGSRISLPPECWKIVEGPEVGDLLRQAVLLASGEEGGLNREHLTSLERLATGTSRSASLDLPGARRAMRCGGWLHIGPIPEVQPAATPIRIQMEPGSHRVMQGIEWTSLVDHPLTIRTLYRGEKCPGRQATIDEELRIRGVPPGPRKEWPLVVDQSDSVCWYAGEEDAGSDRPSAPVSLQVADPELQQELSYHLLRILARSGR